MRLKSITRPTNVRMTVVWPRMRRSSNNGTINATRPLQKAAEWRQVHLHSRKTQQSRSVLSRDKPLLFWPRQQHFDYSCRRSGAKVSSKNSESLVSEDAWRSDTASKL